MSRWERLVKQRVRVPVDFGSVESIHMGTVSFTVEGNDLVLSIPMDLNYSPVAARSWPVGASGIIWQEVASATASKGGTRWAYVLNCGHGQIDDRHKGNADRPARRRRCWSCEEMRDDALESGVR